MKPKTKDHSTEEKILVAARKVFTKKGYAATRTRDIAEESGINLALLNYYFKSKELLFEAVMIEKIAMLFGQLMPVLLETELSLNKKIELLVDRYIDMLLENPDLPVFVMSELRNHPDRFLEKMPVDVILRESHFIRQIQDKHPDQNPIHYLMNILGMVIFPFVMKPVFAKISKTDDKGFKTLMKERKKLIPIWVEALMEI